MFMSNAKDIVMEFVDAMERKDFKTVRSHISDNKTRTQSSFHVNIDNYYSILFL